MTSSELAKVLWDLANGLTAFAVVQALVFAYACAKKETGDIINRRAIKLALAVMLVAVGIGQGLGVWWCGDQLCALDVRHCDVHTQATHGRIAFIAMSVAFSLLILYARQLLAHKPFDG